MAVQVQCSACGARFSAPDSLIGKRVRCKKCGEVFAVGAAGADGDDISGLPGDLQPQIVSQGIALPTDTLPAAQAEKLAVKSALKQLREREQKVTSFGTEGPDVDMDSLLKGDGSNQDGDLGAMRSMGQFDFPYSAQVDRFLPPALLVISLACVAMQAFSQPTGGTAWIAPLRIFLLALTFVAIVFPMTYQGLKGSIRNAGMGLPWSPRLKALGALAVPVAMGYALWTVGESIATLAIGLIVGLLVALAALWPLYRLRPDQLLKPMLTTAAWFIFSSAVASGFLFGLNLTVQSIVAGGGSSELTVSPIAPHMSWIAPEKPVAKKPPASANPKPTDNATKPTPKPTVPVSNPGSTASGTNPGHAADGSPSGTSTGHPSATGNSGNLVPPSEEVIQSIPTLIDPPSPRPQDPVAGNEGNTAPSTPVVTTPAVPVKPPVAEAQVNWSEQVTSAEAILPDSPFDQVIAPLTASNLRLLASRNGNGDDNLELWTCGKTWDRIGQTSIRKDPQMPGKYALTPTSGNMVRLVSWPALSVQAWSFKESMVVSNVALNSNNGTPELIGCTSDQQAVIFWTNGERHAMQLVDLSPGTGQALPGWQLSGVQTAANNFVIMPDGKSILMTALAADGPRVMQIQLPSGKVSDTFRIPLLDPKWGVKPAALSLSPDGQLLAAMFANGGNAVVLQWQMPKGTPIRTPQTYLAGMLNTPPAAFVGNAIVWLDDSTMLINGRDVINAQTGSILKPLCDVPVLGVVAANADELELLLEGASRKGRLMHVQLSPPAPSAP